ncbi:hypothetical protein A2U01_0068698, partial [Trifolium medium]|nr:hypothetical protein [Trifolium medium]
TGGAEKRRGARREAVQLLLPCVKASAEQPWKLQNEARSCNNNDIKS